MTFRDRMGWNQWASSGQAQPGLGIFVAGANGYDLQPEKTALRRSAIYPARVFARDEAGAIITHFYSPAGA